MGIPLAALGVRTPQFKSPLDQMTKAVHLKSLLQGQEINKFNLQQAQRGAQQQQQAQAGMQALFNRADGKLDKMIELAPQAGIGMEAYQNLIDRRTKRRQELQKMTLDDLKIGREKAELLSRSVSAMLSLPADQRPQAVLQAIPSLVEDPEEAQQYQQLAQLPAEQLEQTLNMFRLLGVDSTEQFKAEEKRKARTTKEKDFQFWANTERKARGLPRNAKTESMLRAEYHKRGEKKPTTPFAAFAFGGPEEQKLARQWVALQNKYRGSSGDKKLQLDSINARFNREMQVVKAQIGFPGDPTEEQIARMEGILRKANEDYDAVLSGKAPEQGKPADTVSVISPDGVRGKIPRAQLQDAIQQGYRKVE